jgi:hypothetical protein
MQQEYNVLTDPEFKADCINDQILYEKTPHTQVMKVECSWCKADMGTKPCNEGQQDKVSHGICGSCKIKMEEEISDYEEVR